MNMCLCGHLYDRHMKRHIWKRKWCLDCSISIIIPESSACKDFVATEISTLQQDLLNLLQRIEQT